MLFAINIVALTGSPAVRYPTVYNAKVDANLSFCSIESIILLKLQLARICRWGVLIHLDFCLVLLIVQLDYYLNRTRPRFDQVAASWNEFVYN